MKRIQLIGLAVILAAASTTSCVSPDPYVRAGRRTGVVAGGITGAIIGNNVGNGNAWAGAAIGAAVGGLAGDRRGKINSMYYGSQYPYYY